jgi:hypothetical protein
MGPSSEGTVPFQIIHFLRFVWALVKSVFNEPIHQNSMLEYDHFFVSQQHSWDCGLACCNMILRWCGDGFSQQLTEDSVCSDERPLWTIELFHMLQSAGVEVEMYTKYRGVNPAHHKLRWYENAHDSELLRIQECFEQTEKEQLPVFERSISLEQLKSAAKDSNTAIILLLDVHTLLKRTNRYAFCCNADFEPPQKRSDHCVNPYVLLPAERTTRATTSSS